MTTGNIQNRDRFLDHVAEHLGRQRKEGPVERPVWKTKPQWDIFKGFSQDALVDVLEKQCKMIHTHFKRTTSEKLQRVIQESIADFEGKSVVVANCQQNDMYDLVDFYKKTLPEQGLEVRIWDPSRERENITFAEKADVGITFSDITLAESGTVTLFNQSDNGRSISLLPKAYIAIIPKSTIVPRMTQAAHYIHNQNEQGMAMPSCISFITGPSNSADIEMNLIVGVHGPIHVTYIVVDNI